MHTTRRTLIGGLSLFSVASAFPAVARDDRSAKASAALDAVFEEHAPPAMAAALVERGKVVWAGVRGVRQSGGVEPVTLDDVWHLGSNGKAMTAVLYARLVEQGRARWDVTMGEIFPDLSPSPRMKDVTIDDLLCHHSGLIDADALPRARLPDLHLDPRSARDQRAELARNILSADATGRSGEFGYSNVNYMLAGAAVERLIDQSWEEAIRIEVFDVLGMNSVGHGLPQGEQPWGHRQLDPERRGAVDPVNSRDNPPALGPAGRLHMTVQDYGRFLGVYTDGGGGLLTPASVARLTTARAAGGRPYAYGWGIREATPWSEGALLEHEGSNGSWHVTATAAPGVGRAAFSVSNILAPAANRAMSAHLLAIYSA